MPQTIYCDESGYTGNNLLDAGSPFFTYAAVALDEGAAREVVDRTIRNHRLDGAELKGARLVGHARGRRAIGSILEECRGQALVIAFHKRYSLACKFFEYIFEPVLAAQNSIFYNAGFHRFVSNIVFFEALANTERATTALSAFQDVMRAREPSKLPSLFPVRGIADDYSEVLRDIEAFFLCHREVIAADIADHSREEPLYAWMLELSVTGLYSLLTAWGERHDSMLVLADESKPLRDMREPFDIMIGRTDRPYVNFEGKRHSLIFNLAAPLRFVPSREHPGIQLADVFASTLNWSLRNQDDETARSWLAILQESLNECSIFPDAEVVNLNDDKAIVSRLILRELVDRSVQKQDLFEGMPAFIAAARAVVRRDSHLALGHG